MNDIQPNGFCSRAHLITQIYKEYFQPVCNFMKLRTNNHFLAEDLAQDVFVRLLNYELMLRQETIQSFVFTIAKNILIDFMRRKTAQPEYVDTESGDLISAFADKADSRILYKEIFLLEKVTLSTLPVQRKKVYIMNRFDDMNCTQISEKLNISKRTAEAHLYQGRKEIREAILKCV